MLTLKIYLLKDKASLHNMKTILGIGNSNWNIIKKLNFDEKIFEILELSIRQYNKEMSTTQSQNVDSKF
jgi:hypothetical protein